MEPKVVLTIIIYHLAIIMRTTRRKVNCWSMTMFFNIFDITGIASYNMCLSNNPDWKISQRSWRRRTFLTVIGYAMVTPHMA